MAHPARPASSRAPPAAGCATCAHGHRTPPGGALQVQVRDIKMAAELEQLVSISPPSKRPPGALIIVHRQTQPLRVPRSGIGRSMGSVCHSKVKLTALHDWACCPHTPSQTVCNILRGLPLSSSKSYTVPLYHSFSVSGSGSESDLVKSSCRPAGQNH